MSAPSLPARALGHFLAPAERAQPLAAEPAAAPTRFAPRAAVLGSPSEAPPVAAALANALRAAHRSATALVAVWAPPDARRLAAPPYEPAPHDADRPPLTEAQPPGGESARPPSAPATPAAARLSARLTARGLPSAARGRLAWLPLADHPVAAALATRRAAGALEVPVVVALAGPRTGALEPLLHDQDLVVVVTADSDGALARIACASVGVPAVACPPLAAGPRLLALAGVAGARTLAEPIRTALDPLRLPPEPAW